MSEGFTPTKLEEERSKDKTAFIIWLNLEERKLLDKCKEIIEQPKDSTAIKQLAWIGATNLLDDKKISIILSLLFKNKRNNKRVGIVDFEWFYNKSNGFMNKY